MYTVLPLFYGQYLV